MTYAWEGEEQTADVKTLAVGFAKNYLVFLLDPRAKALFEYWEDVYARRRTPVNASINEYVANETMREFLQKIREQIQFAQREGQ